MKLDVFNTHMELSPYNEENNIPMVEDLYIIEDKFTMKPTVCGFLIDNGTMYFPKGTPINMIENAAGITANRNHKSDTSNRMSRIHYTNLDLRDDLQKQSVEFLTKESNAQLGLNLQMGYGKGLPITAKLPTPYGYTSMGDIKIGDKVLGSNGIPTTVTGVYDQGIEDVYKIFFEDGRYTLCDLAHLWNVTNNHGVTQTLSTKEIMEDYKNTEYKIPRFCAPAKYENDTELPVNPYFVGMMLGTKYYHSKYLTLSLEDHSCIDKIAFYNKYEIIQTGNNIYRFKDKDGYVTTREFFKDTPSLINYNNHIPSLYKYSSIANRMSLLKGLIASNGEIDNEGNVFYNCKSYSLMEDVKELIWGLGLLITNINRTGIKIDMNKSIKLYLFPHKDSIIMPLPDVYLDRYLKIVDIRKVTRAHCKCIAVDAENKLYLTEKFIVTHNTFVSCYAATKLNEKFIVVTHSEGIKNQWIKIGRAHV